MNTNEYLDQLQASLSPAAYLTQFGTFTPDDCRAGLFRATIALSVWRPLLRRIGSAQVVFPASTGKTTLTVAGGLFRAGDAVYVDFCGPQEQAATIASVAPLAAADGPRTDMAALLVLTLSAPLSSSVAEGALVEPSLAAGGASRGLLLPAGRDTARLPGDFLAVEQDSFDVAVGARADVRRGNGYYDAAYYTATRSYASAGIGQSSNYGPGFPGNYPVVGNIADNPNGTPGRADGAAGAPVLYRFLTQGTAPSLVRSPAPDADIHLDFYYFGSHIPLTVPNDAVGALLAYGRYACLSAQAAALGGIMDGSDTDATNAGSRNAAALNELAQAAHAEFETFTRFRAVALSG